MGAKKTAYAVTSGECSSYCVHWLFENFDDAAQTARRIGGEVEALDLYAPGSGSEITVIHQWIATAIVNPAGQVDEAVPCFRIGSFSDEVMEAPGERIREVKDQRWCDLDGNIARGSQYEIRVWAHDEVTARKMARERAAELATVLAEGGTPDLAG